MATYITMDAFDTRTIRRGTRRLQEYDRTTLEPVSDDLARGVAEQVQGYMSVLAHVETGTLRRNLLDNGIRHVVMGEYTIKVDPVKDGDHYAAKEAEMGGLGPDGSEHDFTRDNEAVAREEAPLIWNRLRSRL